jgi:copper(I)-binding protein
MLIGLKAPLKAGHKLPFAVTVRFSDGSTQVLRILAQIKPLDSTNNPSPSLAQPEAQSTATMHEHHH